MWGIRDEGRGMICKAWRKKDEGLGRRGEEGEGKKETVREQEGHTVP